MKNNHGVDWTREKKDRSKEDWILGAKTISGIADDASGLVIALFAWPKQIKGVYQRATNPLNHCVIFFNKIFEEYYPKGEKQYGREDFMDCVTRGFHNEIEKQLNYSLKNNILSRPTVEFLQQYIVDGEVELSDRFGAILSNTTRRGNGLKNVINTISNVGCIPKTMLQSRRTMTWADYHKRVDITMEMEDLGQEFLKHIRINYAVVMASHFPRFAGEIKWEIFDNYLDRGINDDWVKRLVPNYVLSNYGYKIILNNPIINTKAPMKVKQNCLYQLVEHPGGFALGLDGKLVIDKTDLILATWIGRNKGKLDGQFATCTSDDWHSVEHINLKREIIEKPKTSPNNPLGSLIAKLIYLFKK